MLSPPSLVGLAVGLVPVGLSFTPSLLPRPFVMQGVITGICVALGYGIGVFAKWVVPRLTKWEPAPRAPPRAPPAVGRVSHAIGGEYEEGFDATRSPVGAAAL